MKFKRNWNMNLLSIIEKWYIYFVNRVTHLLNYVYLTEKWCILLIKLHLKHVIINLYLFVESLCIFIIIVINVKNRWFK
jgi:hypothetical protein